jgi:hypothetical protein
MEKDLKDLLLKDLCARLPYKVKIQCINSDNETVIEELFTIGIEEDIFDCNLIEYISVKPYLFPLSSMTEEQSMELFKLFGISLVDSTDTDYIKINECTGITFFLNKGFDVETHLDKLVDWLNKNHFDWRGLIPMGLAIDATNLNIY